MMAMMEQFLPIILQNPVVDELTAESYAYLDVAGYNYTESRYGMDHELHPHRVIVGSETPAVDRGNWQLVREHPTCIGDFTWTGWDYLGEAGIGRVRYASDLEIRGFMAQYPWLTAHVRRHRHHRTPSAGVVLARDRVGSARRAISRGASACAPRREQRCRHRMVVHRRGRDRGRGPASRASP